MSAPASRCGRADRRTAGGLRGRAAALLAGGGGPAPLGRLLAAASRLYGAYMRRRRTAIRRLPLPVVSIGNLTVGGTGKTPLAVDLARRVRALGLSPAVVSRGYRGGGERRGAVVSDGCRLLQGPQAAGDEPYLIACLLPGVPVVVGRDRCRAGRLAWELFRPDVLILDDGFQHRRLGRDLDLLLLDWRRPFGSGRLLPAGELREPPEALARADAVVVTRAPADARALASPAAGRILAACARGPVFFCRHRPRAAALPGGAALPPSEFPRAPVPPEWLGRRAFAFSGIARNEEFPPTAAALGFQPAGALAFPDHHRYRPRDVAAILAAARAAGAELLLTTEKDYARLVGFPAWPLDRVVIGVDIAFGRDEEPFAAFLQARLAAARGADAAGAGPQSASFRK